MPGARTSDYDFALPDALIAQTPLPARDASRLMVVDRAAGTITHASFADLPTMIPAGDALVLNTTRVFRARLLGTRDSGAPAEVLLLRATGPDTFEAMVHPGAKLKPGRRVTIASDLVVEMLAPTDRGTREVRLLTEGDPMAAVERHGHIPLPPYIQRADAPEDAARYQTVFATQRGLGRRADRGAALHARAARPARGAGRSRASTSCSTSARAPSSRWTSTIPTSTRCTPSGTRSRDAAAAALADVRAAGGHVWAVGTTSARTLESAAQADGPCAPVRRDTALFIRPGYRFRAVDRLLTNFHLPRSTLLMLVSALAGYELTMRRVRRRGARGLPVLLLRRRDARALSRPGAGAPLAPLPLAGPAQRADRAPRAAFAPPCPTDARPPHATRMYPTLLLLQVSTANPMFGTLFMYVAIAAIFYFILYRPQKAQKQLHEQTIRSIKRGDDIVTAGGLVGEVVSIKEAVAGQASPEDQVTIRSGESRLVVERGRIARVVIARGVTPAA